jgi:serine/threonine protein kinase
MREVGTVLQDRYVVGHLLGRGGMGAVYEAFDRRLSRPVALKETLGEEEELRRAFEREARLLANLSHPGLPNVNDHFVEASGQYLVMEFVPGVDLGELLDKGELISLAEILQWGDELLDVVEYLHSREPPVFHRDIKPANLKIQNARLRLLDFGLAKGSVGVTTMGRTSKTLLGYTKAYAPLEQINGEKTNARTDLYAIGATLYHLITGNAPADSVSRANALLNGANDPLIPISRFRHGVPREVEAVVLGALEVRLSDRPISAAEMRNQLRHARASIDRARATTQETLAVKASERRIASFSATKGVQKTERRVLRSAGLRAIAALAGIVTLVGLLFLGWYSIRQPRSAQSPSDLTQEAPNASAQQPSTPSQSATPTPAATPDIHTVDFRTVKAPLAGSGLTQKDVGYDRVAYGDMDGDGSYEAVVLFDFSYARSGGNGYGNFGYVYKMIDGKASAIAPIRGGFGVFGGYIASVKISDTALTVRRCDLKREAFTERRSKLGTDVGEFVARYLPVDQPADDTKVVATTVYHLNGTTLKVVATSLKESDDCPSPRMRN